MAVPLKCEHFLVITCKYVNFFITVASEILGRIGYAQYKHHYWKLPVDTDIVTKSIHLIFISMKV